MRLLQTLFGSEKPTDPLQNVGHRGQPVETIAPWQRISVRPIGGLTAIGFDRASDTLLVTSSDGQSVIDAASGEIQYRNKDNDGLDIAALKATRLNHPADERIDMCGLFGGALRCVTNDGWSATQVTHGTQTACLLHLTNQTTPSSHLLSREQDEIRAFGFSWTGQTLALATSTTLTLWNRPAPLQL